MKIDILTLFPSMFAGVLDESIIGRARKKNIININYVNIRDFSEDKHKRVDDYPFGGGPGMVMKPEPIYRALDSVKSEKAKVIYVSPKGKVYNQSIAQKLACEEHLIFLCGHYEGIDNRIVENYITDEISIGDYVLTGGELPSMVIIDSIARLLPGVLKNEESYTDESHYNGILEYPQYTRPRVFNSIGAPEILLTGNHKKIDEWRLYESLKTTFLRRPDLLDKKKLSSEEKILLEKIKTETNSNK